MLLEPTGAPGESWVFSCRMSDNIVNALGKNSADVVVTLPGNRKRTLYKAAKVAVACIQFQFGCKDYAYISKKVGRRVTKMRVYFRIFVDNRPVWSRPYVNSSEQWKCLQPTDEMVIGSRWLQWSITGIQPQKEGSVQRSNDCLWTNNTARCSSLCYHSSSLQFVIHLRLFNNNHDCANNIFELACILRVNSVLEYCHQYDDVQPLVSDGGVIGVHRWWCRWPSRKLVHWQKKSPSYISIHNYISDWNEEDVSPLEGCSGLTVWRNHKGVQKKKLNL